MTFLVENALALVALALALVALGYHIWLHLRIRETRAWLAQWRETYERAVRDQERAALDGNLIEQWKQAYEELPPESPKWRAYRNRLIEVGELPDGD